MAVVHKYRVWCNTEAAWKFVWGETPPTQCPDNTADTIDLNSISIIETTGDAQSFTEEGAALIAKKDRGELAGNSVILKLLDAELAPETSTFLEWVIPSGKQWNIRLFSASTIVYEVEARLECWDYPVVVTSPPTTQPSTTVPPVAPVLVRQNPFNNDADEPIATLKLDGNAAQSGFYESLPFSGNGTKRIRIVLVNKDPLDSVESSASFNGYESASV